MILVNGSIDVNGNISIYIEKRLYGYQVDLDTTHVILLNTELPNRHHFSKGTSINHVVKILDIFDSPPPFVVTFTK